MAKILKKRRRYLEEKAKRNAKVALALSFSGSVFLALSFFFIPFLIYLSIIQFSFALFFFERYRDFKKGFEGELLVIKQLMKLDDSYLVLNDIKLSPRENIDHIVIGPNGVFVIETKNYEGDFVCENDRWIKRYYTKKGLKEYEIKSPSKQVKRNAIRVKKIIREKANMNVWVDAIVVFIKASDIILKNCGATVLNLDELPEYIKNKKGLKLSPQQIKTIGKLF
ncbi:MAG: NERD domain-containing protein [Thermoplasmata archaeon]|nr:MAG: NERD domain-containing protein [Thermoplasmata archaeon]